MSKIVFTKYSSPRPLSKVFSLNNNKIVKQANVLYEGTAETIHCSFRSFYKHLLKADACTAFGYGNSEHETIKITSKRTGLADGINYITRSKANYRFPKEGGVVMLDHDPSRYSEYNITPQQFLRILKKIHPALGDCACIVRDSVSAGVRHNGKPLEAKGFHVYIPVSDASDIPRFGKLLHQYLWQHGYGYISLSKDGKMFEKSLIDVAVFSPERLDFVGKPVVISPLKYAPPRCGFRSGEVLDTRLLQERGVDIELVSTLIKHAKKRILPLQKEVQQQYDHKQVLRLIDQGHTGKEAEAIVARCRTNGYRFIDESHKLYFSNGIVCSVKEAIEQGLYGEYLADPIEGTEYGTTTAQLIKRNGHPFIRSFAHGGRNYRISFQKAFNLSVLTANPGYGKTYAMHPKVWQLYKQGEYVCLVVPTTKLMEQCANDLMKHNAGIGSYRSDIHCISHNESNQYVGEQLGFAVNDGKRLILITNSCLKMMRPEMYKKMAHYHVFIDEVFDPMLSCEQYSLKKSIAKDGFLKRLCDWEPIEWVQDAYVLTANKFKRFASSALIKEHDGKNTLSTAERNKVLTATKDKTKVVIISKMNRAKKGDYCIAEMYNCNNLKYFKSCTLVSAFIEETALYHWCNLYFNMIDVTEEYAARFQDLSARMKKLTVMPFTEHYTKHVRNTSRFTKRQSLKTIKTQTLVNRIIKHCSYFDENTLRVMNNDDFMMFGDYEYLANTHDIEGTRISSQVHGLNQYKHINSAIIVAAFNLKSHQTAFLNKLLPFYDPWLERNVLTTIQCFMRTSLRDKNSKDSVYVMVPDVRTCEAIISLYNDLPKIGTHCLAAEYEIN